MTHDHPFPCIANLGRWARLGPVDRFASCTRKIQARSQHFGFRNCCCLTTVVIMQGDDEVMLDGSRSLIVDVILLVVAWHPASH